MSHSEFIIPPGVYKSFDKSKHPYRVQNQLYSGFGSLYQSHRVTSAPQTGCIGFFPVHTRFSLSWSYKSLRSISCRWCAHLLGPESQVWWLFLAWNFFYVGAILELHTKIWSYSDQTHKLDTKSDIVNLYLFFLYKYDHACNRHSKSINCPSLEWMAKHLQTAYIQRISAQKPYSVIECSYDLKAAFGKYDIEYQLVLPTEHGIDATKRAICTFKIHLIEIFSQWIPNFAWLIGTDCPQMYSWLW